MLIITVKDDCKRARLGRVTFTKSDSVDIATQPWNLRMSNKNNHIDSFVLTPYFFKNFIQEC